MKVKDMPNGAILWGGRVIGIKGYTLDKKYYEKECRKVPGNIFDYELIKEVKKNETI